MKKVLASGGIVINEKNEMLLIYRHSKWDLPKGNVEKGESFEDCALREVKEETGIGNLYINRHIGTTEHEYFDSYLGTDVIKETHWFEMKTGKEESLHPQTEEGIEWIRWVSIEYVSLFLKNSYKNIMEIVQNSGLVVSKKSND